MSTTRVKHRPIQNVRVHAPKSMDRNGHGIYNWLDEDERFIVQWNGDGDDWNVYVKLSANVSCEEAFDILKALGVKEIS